MPEATISLDNHDEELAVLGSRDQLLRQVRDTLRVKVLARPGQIRVEGDVRPGRPGSAGLRGAATAIPTSADDLRRGRGRRARHGAPSRSRPNGFEAIEIRDGNRAVRPRTEGQAAYLRALRDRELVFCVGPAGTGKTYLAVAVAVAALRRGEIKKIVLVRPAVEAGERLGFLPGDLEAKINPYLRPLFDALHDLLDYDQLRRYMGNDLIEIAPLAYMRGRTLNDAVIILDEGQNATVAQMKMFLTRMGQNARIVVTGDTTQVDLPPGRSAAWPTPSSGCGGSRASAWSRWTGPTSSGTRWCRRSSTPTSRPSRRPRPAPAVALAAPEQSAVDRRPTSPPWSEAGSGPVRPTRGTGRSRATSARRTPERSEPRTRSADRIPFEPRSMSLGKRRPKALRAQLRPSDPIDIRANAGARRRAAGPAGCRRRWPSLVTAAIVHGSGPPFPYRLGQRPDRDLRVKVREVPAQEPAQDEHRHPGGRRQGAADPGQRPGAAPGAGSSSWSTWSRRSHEADNLAELPESVRSTWGLDQATFDELRAASDIPERREDMKRWIGEAFAPLIRDGDPRSRHPAPQEESASDGAGPNARCDRPPSSPLVGQARAARQARHGRRQGIRRGVSERPRWADASSTWSPSKLAGNPTLNYEEARPPPGPQGRPRRGRDVYDAYDRGDLLVEQGQTITEDQLDLLRLEHETSVGRLSLGDRLRRAGSVVVLVGALFALIGDYVHRHEPRVARSLPRIAVLCGLVAGAMGLARLLALQPWDAELIPIALTAMILAIAYNPHFALMVTFALCLLLSLALGTGLGYFLVLMGGTAAGVLLLGGGPHPDQADPGRRGGRPGLLRADLGHRALAEPAAGPDRQRQPLAGRLGTAGRLLARRQLAVRREGLRDRHRHQPAGTRRHHPPTLAGTGPPAPRHAQPLGHRRHDRRGRRRADRRQCPARADRGLFPRHRQDAQAALFHREPGRR